jgi:hypothetical protein
MNRNIKSLYVFVGFSMLIIFSCMAAGKTTLKSVWKDANYAGGDFKKILIIGAAERHPVRRDFENEFADQLQAKGIHAVKSHTIIPADKMLDKKTVLSKIQDLNIDAVLVTRLLYQETASQLYPKGKVYVKTPSYYNDFNDYINHSLMSRVSGDPNRLVHLETNFYGLKNEKRIWSALSDTFVEGSPKREIKDYIKIMIKQMSDDGLLE